MDWFWLFVSSTVFYILVLAFLKVFDSDDISEVDDSMGGFSIIVTGANSGIGKQTALQLAARGASVTLACRNMKSGNDTAQYITSQTGNKYIDVQYLDLADFESIRKFAQKVQRCHCLINNAGCILIDRAFRDGTELTIRTNHLGPFLLTNLLLPCLITSSAMCKTESRIIFVGSKLEKNSDIELGNLACVSNGPEVYDKWLAYANSKLCNLLTAAELNRRLPEMINALDPKARVTVNTVSPGMVNTGLSRFMPQWQRMLFLPLSYMFMRTPSQGADSVVFAATSNELSGISGKFISNRKFVSPSERAQNLELATQVWKESEKIVKSKRD